MYWGVHAKNELSDCARSLALQLFREYDGHISAVLFVDATWGLYEDLATDILWTGLHCASYFGIVEVVVGLIELGCYDLNEGGFRGGTPLSWAAENGHEEVVNILLGQEEVNPDKADNFNVTPLCKAAENGHEGVVKILLGREGSTPGLRLLRAQHHFWLLPIMGMREW